MGARVPYCWTAARWSSVSIERLVSATSRPRKRLNSLSERDRPTARGLRPLKPASSSASETQTPPHDCGKEITAMAKSATNTPARGFDLSDAAWEASILKEGTYKATVSTRMSEKNGFVWLTTVFEVTEEQGQVRHIEDLSL